MCQCPQSSHIQFGGVAPRLGLVPVILLGALLAVSLPRPARAGRLTVSGSVRDAHSMTVHGALVEFTDQLDPSGVFADSTNAAGWYEVIVDGTTPAEAEPPLYTVSITGRGILPFSRSDVSVREDVEMDFEVGRTNIRWLGHASIKILGEKTIYIDPWKLEQPEPADLILITHSHSDHCSPDDVAKIQTDTTVIVTIADCAGQLTGDVRVVAPGDSLTVNGVEVLAVPAYNLEKSFHPKAKGWVGYVVTVNNMRIYHAGDTDLIPEMADVDTDVALLPIGGTYTMDARQAAEAANVIRPKLAIPLHFGDIVGSSEDARLFAELCDVPVEILDIEP